MSVNLSIKNVPDALAEKLRQRAEANHRSLQGELMAIIEVSVGARAYIEGRDQPSAPETDALAIQTEMHRTYRRDIGASRSSLSKDARPESKKLTLRELVERMRQRFPAPLVTAPGMSSVEIVRQMRDGRDGDQWRDPDHHEKGY